LFNSPNSILHINNEKFTLKTALIAKNYPQKCGNVDNLCF